jgi:hypothetical protein
MLMKAIRAYIFGTMLAAVAIIAVAPIAMAQKLVAQAPCNGDFNGVCATMSSGDIGPKTLRRVTLTTHGPGKAHLQFEGTVFCTSTNTMSNLPADFDTQIMAEANGDPDGTGPGGARFRQVIGERNILDGGASMNLNSSRVVTIAAAGNHRFYLRAAGTNIVPNTTCRFFQNRFTVLFLPN